MVSEPKRICKINYNIYNIQIFINCSFIITTEIKIKRFFTCCVKRLYYSWYFTLWGSLHGPCEKHDALGRASTPLIHPLHSTNRTSNWSPAQRVGAAGDPEKTTQPSQALTAALDSHTRRSQFWQRHSYHARLSVLISSPTQLPIHCPQFRKWFLITTRKTKLKSNISNFTK